MRLYSGSPRLSTPKLRLSQLLAALTMAAALHGQTILMEPAAPLLPQKFGAWQRVGDAVTGTDATQIDSAHTTELKEDGLSRFSTATYSRGASKIEVKAMQFVDATGASAALSLYRSSNSGLHPVTGAKIATEASAGGNEVLFRTGNTMVMANAPGVQATELQALAITLPKISGPKGMSPFLPTLLPAKGLIPESVRYAVGPTSYTANGGGLPTEILGFDKSAEVSTANYSTHSGKELLTMLLYPTPQIAGEKGRAIEGWLNAHSEGLGTIKLRREGPLVLLATGSFPADEAQQMIENVHLKAEVTWDKKMPQEFHSEVKKTASLLVSIAVLSGVLMLAAVLLGLFLGGGRAAYRVMRGKSAATDAEFLGLGLERGPVKAITHEDGTERK